MTMRSHLTTRRQRWLITSRFLIVTVFMNLFVPSLLVQSASASHAHLQGSEQDQIDAYIESRMQLANIAGLALGAVRGDQIVYLKGYGLAGRDGRAVTPQTPF